jgi:uncharacterized membrane protein
LLKVGVNTQTINSFLQNHQDFPSLLSVSDLLNSINIANAAGKTGLNNLDTIPTPFLITTKNSIYPLMVVEKLEQDTITVYYGKKKKSDTITKDEFSIIWNNIFLLSELSENSGIKNYKKFKQTSIIKNVLVLTCAILSLYFAINLLNNNILESSIIYSTINFNGQYFQFIISFIGFIVTVALLWYEIDQNNYFLQRICTSVKKGNCGAILSGRYAKVTNWLSWSDVSFIYFTGNLCVIMFSENSVKTASFISWISLASLSYSVFSVYYQWKVAKQWCVFCLIIQFVFFANVINALIFSYYHLPFALNLSFLFNVFLYYIFVYIILALLKPYIIKFHEQINLQQRYLKLKFNPVVFSNLLNISKRLADIPTNFGLLLGNPKAKNTLIVISEPYCNPCSRVYPKIEQLLEKYTNLKVQIVFMVSDISEKENTKPVKFFLAVKEINEQELLKKVLNKWYSDNNKNFVSFRNIYEIPDELLAKQSNNVLQMKKWCETADIQFTPTFFFNGYQLPSEYSVEDLQYFLIE